MKKGVTTTYPNISKKTVYAMRMKAIAMRNFREILSFPNGCPSRGCSMALRVSSFTVAERFSPPVFRMNDDMTKSTERKMITPATT